MGFKEECERVKRETDLLSYVHARTGIEFKKVGNTQQAKECPFCGSGKRGKGRRGSGSGFNIKQNTQYFTCFACGRKGSIIDFEMTLSNCDERQALRIIQGKTGDALPLQLPGKDNSSASKKEKPVFGYIWELSRLATKNDFFRWLNSPKRAFGQFAEEGARLLLAGGVRFNDYKGQDCLVFAVRDAKLSLVAIHKIAIAGSPIGETETDKISIGPMNGVWHFDRASEVVFVVESAANALSLACLGYSAAALMSIANLKNVAVVKALFPDKHVVLWMDKSDGHIEKQQRKAMAQYQVEGIFWGENRPDKYDINDLLKEGQGQFDEAVAGYLAGAVPWERKRPVREESLLPYLEQEAVDATISAAFKGWEGQTLIVAPPGTGKTTGAQTKELEAVSRAIPYAYVANNTKDLDDFHDEVTRKTSAYILCLEGGKKELAGVEGEEAEAIQAGKSGLPLPQTINTHTTYSRRKGVGKNFYSFMNWVRQKNPFLVIDEINEFVDSLETWIPIELMSTTSKRKGNATPYTTVYHECPAFTAKAYKCQYCQVCKGLRCRVDTYGNATISIPSNDADRIIAEDWKIETGQTVDLPEVNFSVTKVLQTPSYLEKKLQEEKLPTVYQEGDIFTKEEVNDLMQCSLFPCIVEVYPTLDGKRFEHRYEVTDKDKARVKFPSRACGRYLVFLDVFPLLWFARHTRGVRVLSTTIRKGTLTVLRTVFPALAVAKAKREIDRLDGVAVIGFSESLGPRGYMETLDPLTDRGVKTLRFEPNDRKAETCYAKASRVRKENGEYVRVALIQGGKRNTRAEYTMSPLDHAIANSFGSLGKALSLTEFSLVTVSGELAKPQIAFFRASSREEILTLIQAHRTELMIQNAARILRGKGRKVILFHNVDRPTFERLVERLNLEEIAQQHHSRYVEQEEGLVYELASAYLTDGGFPDREEKRNNTEYAFKETTACPC